MSPFERYLILRASGNVLRYHTQPLIGTQTVATHTWHAVQLLLTVFPMASCNLILAVLHHDAHESVTGDLAAPAKRRFHDLNVELEAAEEQVAEELGLWIALDEFETRVLRIVDTFECCFFALEQKQLGHRGMDLVFNRSYGRVSELLAEFEEEDHQILYAADQLLLPLRAAFEALNQ